MSSATSLLSRRSFRARWGRNLFIALIIASSVAFIMGSFVLANSMRKTFDDLFQNVTEKIDFQVRAASTDTGPGDRDPIDASIADTLSTIDGVDSVEKNIDRIAQMMKPDGTALTVGPPVLAVSWTPDYKASNIVLREGEAPDAINEVAIDIQTATRTKTALGDQLILFTEDGPQPVTVVGLVGVGTNDGLAGAVLSVTDFDSARTLYKLGDKTDTIDVTIDEGANLDKVVDQVRNILPDGVEVNTGKELADEQANAFNKIINAFGTGLLIFAFITAFVSAFIISNVFNITIGQRLRELALLRAVGANTTQVRRLVVGEALLIAVVATAIGIVGGFGVARGLIFMFDKVGGGFPPIPLVSSTPGIITAIVVGIGVTLASVLIPAQRAARIPPVAALQPELGFVTKKGRTGVLSFLAMGAGVAMFLVGMFMQPGGGAGLAGLGGGGALFIFLGLSGVTATTISPIVKVLGAPIAAMFKVPGQLAVGNARRSPRRTATTATALMIGVALICGASVFAASLRTSVNKVLEESLSFDYFVTNPTSRRLPPSMLTELDKLPELGVVTGFREVGGNFGKGNKSIAAIEPAKIEQVTSPKVVSGGFTGLTDSDGIMVYTKEAEALDVETGDTLDVTWENTKTSTLTVAGTFEDASLGAKYYISNGLLTAISDKQIQDSLVLALLADGVTPEQGRPAIEQVLDSYPQAKLQDNAEARAEISGQINQLLYMISLLLAMAVLISLIGIVITMALAVFERTREIGLLRAVGMTRGQLKASIRWEAVIVTVFGALVGIGVGLFLGYVAAVAVPDDVISDIAFPVGTIVALLVGAMIAGVFAAIFPARFAAKMDVLEAISSE